MRAEVPAIRSQLPRAKAADFCHNGARNTETHEQLAPHAVLNLAWEAAYPRVARTAGLYSPWHIKAKSLRQSAQP